MTNALTEKERNKKELLRMSMKSFWDMRKDTDLYYMKHSFVFDQRFYGAEWVEYSF